MGQNSEAPSKKSTGPIAWWRLDSIGEESGRDGRRRRRGRAELQEHPPQGVWRKRGNEAGLFRQQSGEKTGWCNGEADAAPIWHWSRVRRWSRANTPGSLVKRRAEGYGLLPGRGLRSSLFESSAGHNLSAPEVWLHGLRERLLWKSAEEGNWNRIFGRKVSRFAHRGVRGPNLAQTLERYDKHREF